MMRTQPGLCLTRWQRYGGVHERAASTWTISGILRKLQKWCGRSHTISSSLFDEIPFCYYFTKQRQARKTCLMFVLLGIAEVSALRLIMSGDCGIKWSLVVCIYVFSNSLV
jgi:hypothetical protein